MQRAGLFLPGRLGRAHSLIHGGAQLGIHRAGPQVTGRILPFLFANQTRQAKPVYFSGQQKGRRLALIFAQDGKQAVLCAGRGVAKRGRRAHSLVQHPARGFIKPFESV